MITLRRSSILSSGKEKELLLHLSVDTIKIDLVSNWKRVFYNEIGEKPWAGEISMSQGRFAIRRADVAALMSNVSRVEIRGQIVDSGTHKRIELRFGFSWYVAISFLLLSVFYVIAAYFIDQLWVTLLILSVWIIQILIFSDRIECNRKQIFILLGEH